MKDKLNLDGMRNQKVGSQYELHFKNVIHLLYFSNREDVAFHSTETLQTEERKA